MSTKKFFTSDKKQGPLSSNLNQVIDIIQEDVSGSATRRKYQTFVTGGIGPGVTSSLYQTVYDQDFTLQTANPILDMTVGLFHYNEDGTADKSRKNLVSIVTETGYNRFDNGQLTFDTKHTMMMREKINIYRQYAKLLLGDANKPFALDVANMACTVSKTNNSGTNLWKDSKFIMDACVFMNVKRLFARDRIRPETFAMRLYSRAPAWHDTFEPEHTTPGNQWKDDFIAYGTTAGTDQADSSQNIYDWTSASNAYNAKRNIFGGDVDSSKYGVRIIADIGGSPPQQQATLSSWSFLKLAHDTTKVVGIIFYDAGIAVLNLGTSTQASSAQWGSGLTNDNGKKYGYGLSNAGDAGLGGDEGTMRPVFEPHDRINGIISGMAPNFTSQQGGWQGGNTQSAGQVFIGRVDGNTTANPKVTLNAGGVENTESGHSVAARVEANQLAANGPKINPDARFYPDLLVSGSIDDIIDHIGYTRFSSGSLTACAFQNSTKIQSSIYFCRASASQFNGSNNDTWTSTNSSGNDEWLLKSTSENQRPYTYITTVLLYDAHDELVAVAKLNRPIEKNSESELTIRVRLDF